jgi:tetratricopeptide (TPR) repeat protein
MQTTTEAVSVRTDTVVFPTYVPAPPDPNPMFLEKRVYQGSSGKVYPLPFTDRVATEPVDRAWKAVWLENEYLRVLVLPEIGGRIHQVLDKTNGYDLVYRQDVIKPALVGLAGPWVSGGIEFNWPQHHRPATFLPVDTAVEHGDDGSVTLWCSDHDPMARMKGMHGVCLRPGVARLELRVRAYNRTPHVQTFLWWANVATRVHAGYQSFFPPDVTHVADHARRSMSRYPRCEGSYYGVDYAARAKEGVPAGECPDRYVPPACGGAPAADYPPDDLSFYANIPVPTSYMCIGSRGDFFGGYDHAAAAGIVHVANHHVSPGKKQWTWGNHAFGYAWDRNLTDAGAAGGAAPGEHAPYIELMAGVYTDNQPDFSFLRPGETKSWTQHWFPIQQIGPAHQATVDGAVSLRLGAERFRIGVSVTRPFPGATVEIAQDGRTVRWPADLAPGEPLVVDESQPAGAPFTVGVATLRVFDADRRAIIEYRPARPGPGEVPTPAAEPPAPAEMASADELFITGLHLEQYRHATRSPTDYWLEALRRDPLDSRCNDAVGRWHLRRGELAEAEQRFRAALLRQTARNGNPYDGESLYNLGLTLRYQLDAELAPADDPRFEQAYAGFYKATWCGAWAAAGFHAVAEMDCRRGDWAAALDHLDRSLRFDTDNLRARDLKAIVLRQLGRDAEATAVLVDTLALDPLDWWARSLRGEPLACDLQTALDLAHDLARAGLYAAAAGLLSDRLAPAPKPDTTALPDQSWGAVPIALYTLAALHARRGDPHTAADACRRAAAAPVDYCFPSRLEEVAVLRWAMSVNPGDARAPYYLGNLFYDRRRHAAAIDLWERSVGLDPAFPIPWRNLGIGYFNVRRDGAGARRAYDAAVAAAPSDARLLFERDQLWKRLGVAPGHRLSTLLGRRHLVDLRDDLTIELAALFNQTGDHGAARDLLVDRPFQPWEGGEGQALGQWVRAHLALGRAALATGDPDGAIDHFAAALLPPPNLGEAKHLLANQSDIHHWLGEAHAAAGRPDRAAEHWRSAAEFKGDFQGMSVRSFSEMTYFSALSMRRLGRGADATGLLRHLLAFARGLFDADTGIDYFATSLPNMLLFDDDLRRRQQTTALFLQAQAHLGLGEAGRARALLADVLTRDPNHAAASDLSMALGGAAAGPPPATRRQDARATA